MPRLSHSAVYYSTLRTWFSRRPSFPASLDLIPSLIRSQGLHTFPRAFGSDPVLAHKEAEPSLLHTDSPPSCGSGTLAENCFTSNEPLWGSDPMGQLVHLSAILLYFGYCIFMGSETRNSPTVVFFFLKIILTILDPSSCKL